MSVLGKNWNIKNSESNLNLTEKLLKNRGLHDEDSVDRFLNPNKERDFHDPFLMKDMERAVERICAAIDRNERIMIFGDYDLDGITGTAILMRTLTKLGASISYRLPHRIEDGYGLREKFIEQFKQIGVKLIITVDNGISCFNEVALANKKNIDVIITDHHTVPQKIPNAFAILHPKMPNNGYPFDELTGSAVALKLAQALLQRRVENHEEEIYKMLDLACIGTIGDFGPLVGENRYIVKEGLRVLNNTRWPGLSRLKIISGVKGNVNTQDIGFLIGPRLNAAGRMSHASDALKLLLQGEAQSIDLAQNLETLNKERQYLTQKLMKKVREQANDQKKNAVVIVHHHEFHAGVIGILAAKVVEEYGRPAIVMEERKDSAVGSCRSIEGFNIFNALDAAKDHLSHFGGHAAAAGFEVSTKNLKSFKKAVQHFADNFTGDVKSQKTIDAECTIEHTEISMTTFNLLKNFQPFGAGNVEPRFVCEGVRLVSFKTVGEKDKHLKFRIGTSHNMEFDCIGFGLGKFSKKLSIDSPMDLLCEIDENIWQGRKSLQLKVTDFNV